MQTTKKVIKKEKEDDTKYDKIREYNDKKEQMTKIKKEMDALKTQIIADKRKELAQTDKKTDDEDYNIEQS